MMTATVQSTGGNGKGRIQGSERTQRQEGVGKEQYAGKGEDTWKEEHPRMRDEQGRGWGMGKWRGQDRGNWVNRVVLDVQPTAISSDEEGWTRQCLVVYPPHSLAKVQHVLVPK
ncbi:hypothetical protein M413DRAFT_12316 [Hebeloma cylindrosporum]|uniref:Uncharacterized protein n=1 Tax=Hebeloma cylindrosporum TaxID=76867 RepID=A0A0C2YD42_HEBCY|nr:hypothetical protein M413DRAFT_12316 [Hebeloma cylindrosporum h7]